MIPMVADRVADAAGYALSDALSCEVTKTEDGEYSLKLEYPFNGDNANMLLLGNQIQSITSRVDTATQPFTICKIEQSINGILSVTAYHKMYALSGYPVRAFDKASRTPSEALDALYQNSPRNPSSYAMRILATESTQREEFGLDRPTTWRDAIFGNGGLLDVYGGYIVTDGNTLTWKPKPATAASKGIIRYGLNLQKFKRVYDASDMYTHAYVYWKNSDELVQVPGLVQLGVTAAFSAATILDLSDEFETAPTTAQLTQKAQELAAQRELTSPEVSLDISFVPLRLAEEYKHMTWLEEIDLFDTVTVDVPMYGSSTTARVTKTQFNVLEENYKKISVGNLLRRLDRTIARLI